MRASNIYMLISCFISYKLYFTHDLNKIGLGFFRRRPVIFFFLLNQLDVRNIGIGLKSYQSEFLEGRKLLIKVTNKVGTIK